MQNLHLQIYDEIIQICIHYIFSSYLWFDSIYIEHANIVTELIIQCWAMFKAPVVKTNQYFDSKKFVMNF